MSHKKACNLQKHQDQEQQRKTERDMPSEHSSTTTLVRSALATPWKIFNPPLPCSLYALVLLSTIHPIIENFIFPYLFYYLLPELEQKPWQKGLLSVLLLTVSPLPRTGFDTYQTLEAEVNAHTTTFWTPLIPRNLFFLCVSMFEIESRTSHIVSKCSYHWDTLLPLGLHFGQSFSQTYRLLGQRIQSWDEAKN